MVCFYPLTAYRSAERTSKGKLGITFDPSKALMGPLAPVISLPCGQCIGCRLERSRQWAVRCVHEASLYSRNCFITLTYDDAHLPQDNSLNIAHFQKFMKRLRKRFGQGVRFFHCGEYGETLGRPHYHACLFNFDFPDRVLWRSENDVKLYLSASLQELWPFGFSTIGDVTFESAAYVARYVMKKVTGRDADEWYERVDPDTGVVTYLQPEYTTMSRRPGIGKGWFEKYSTDVFPSDFLIVNGVKCKPPRYYDTLYDVCPSGNIDKIKRKRRDRARLFACEQTQDRLRIREECTDARVGRLPRNLK